MKLHPMTQRLVDRDGAVVVAPQALDGWVERPGEHVLFFSGDSLRFPEAVDVAVVLPQLRAAFDGRFDIGVVPREHEDAIARRFGVQRWPCLVFLRAGGYLGAISGMQDWSDYLSLIGSLLERETTRTPGIGIPVVAATAAGSRACH